MRCCITLLACGWFLLSPPLKQQSSWIRVKAWLAYASPAETTEFDKKAPYSKWDLFASFGSYEDCQASRSDGLSHAQIKYEIARDAYTKQTGKIAEQQYYAALDILQFTLASVCIPSDAVKSQ